MGVGGVTNVEVNRGAQMIGCEASKTPFKYLEVMVGGKMNRLHSWDVVIDKVMARLSKWKAKTLSIGEAIFFRCVEPGTRKVSWFSWDNVVVSKEVGGLGMSSFFAMNCALLFKWIWRFKVQPKAMWVSVIKAIHGRLGNWDRGVTVDRQVGAEGVQIEEVSNLIDSLEFVEDHDKWVWNLEGDGVFKVSSARRFIDEGLCDMDGMPTRWLKLIHIKVNVLAWRLASNKVPTRFNMSVRGLEILSMVCPGGGGFQILVSRLIKIGLMVRRFEVKEGDIPSKASLFDLIVFHSFIWCNARARKNLDWLCWLKSPMAALL
ncbi:hypothetical protein Tco_0128615 [Tanacetum coccineum]